MKTGYREKKAKKNRAWELDFLRGLSILLVVFDHIMVDIGHIFGKLWRKSGLEELTDAVQFALKYLNSDLRAFWWPVFLFIFFFVSGICTAFSRNNLLRGIKLAVVAGLLSLFTYLAEIVMEADGFFILFGVLHCIAACILLYSLFDFIIGLLNRKNNKWIKAGAFLAIGVVILILNGIYNVPYGTLSNQSLFVEYGDGILLGIFVYTKEMMKMTADYFTILPFAGFFMLGAAASGILYPNKKSLLPKLNGYWHYPFTVPGRFSLLVYLASQLIVVAILALVSYSKLGVFF